jgi:protein O-GlcNAc transferase
MTKKTKNNSTDNITPSSTLANIPSATDASSSLARHNFNINIEIQEDHPKFGYYKKVADVICLIANKDTIWATDTASSILQENSESSEGYFLLGLISLQLDDLGQAVRMIGQAHELNPECQEYVDALAVLHTLFGDLSRGLYFAKLATALSPHPYIHPLLPVELSNYFTALQSAQPSTHFLKSVIEFERRHFKSAANECEKELRINPHHAHCLNHYGRTLAALAKFDGAASAALEAHKLEPKNSMFALHVGQRLCNLGNYDDGLKYFQMALALNDTSVDIAAEIMKTGLYLPNEYSDELRKIGQRLIRSINKQPIYELTKFKKPKDPKVINIAYISDKVFAGELSHFFLPIIEHHNKNRFNIHVYQQSEGRDSVRTTAEHNTKSIRQTNEIDDETLSVIICNDGIDVLVDLCGYSNDQRFSLLKSHPAHIQIGFLRPPYGIGLPGIDYVLSDSITREIDESTVTDNQTVINLNHGLFALEPLEQHPNVNASPADKNGFITFGGTCDLLLLNAYVAKTWSRVLKKLPNSKLLLGNALTIPDAIKILAIERFEEYGVVDQIDFFDSNEDFNPNPEYYHAIDINLDTFPVSGTFSTCEALWMGVPVLSLAGERRESMMGASILTTAGKPGWISYSEEQFVAGAAFLGGNINELAQIRNTLRDDMRESSLFDPKSFTKSLEEAFLRALKIAI